MFNPKRRAIPRTAKRRGGPYGFFRRCNTGAERRLNQPICDGPPARKARTGRNLPDERDDLYRCVQRTWKAQRKGRKAWAR